MRYTDRRKVYEAALRFGKKDLFDITSSKEALVALLLVGGALTVMHFAPYLLVAAMPLARKWKDTSSNRKRFSDTFSYLRRRGYIHIGSKGGGTHIELTSRGRLQAHNKYTRMLAMRPAHPRSWDSKWRLILFDVPTVERVKRDAFRALIRRLGAVMVQKSVWIYPYDCTEEVQLLKDFFGLNDSHVRLVTTNSIGDDSAYRRHFKIV